MLKIFVLAFVLAFIPLCAAESFAAADDADELTKELANPVAPLISVPLQHNFDFGGGPKDTGFRYTLNKRVIPRLCRGTHRV
ncbi:MAG: hypothetical protein HOP18_20160 [Deltaproteobacteria bacterium]|nr:hypothetical protein [Deltaproteobacteria bacterium]